MSAAKHSRIKNVVVAVQLTYWSGRDILFGISRYARRKCHWRLQIVATPYGIWPGDLLHWANADVDGLIVDSGPYKSALAALRQSKIPLVLIGDPKQSPLDGRKALAYVRNDDRGVGQACAQHLLSLGRFNAFGFVPSLHDPDCYCSSLREEGFRETIEAAGHVARVYAAGPDNETSSDLMRLTSWLKALPKPAAVMGVFDQRAVTILDAARNARIKVPDDLVVMGVDNDELLCDFAEPPLSSLAPDHVCEGELCAQVLDRLMKGRDANPRKPVLSTRRTLVERLSTKVIPPGECLARRARDYIKNESQNGIDVSDVANFLGVSRRLADLRFRQFTGKSIHQAIQERRLDELKRRLRETTVPIARLTAVCGFRDLSNAKRLFKRETGMTMRDWRTAPCPGTASEHSD